MSHPFLELAERIRGEIPNLDRAVQRVLAAWPKVRRMPEVFRLKEARRTVFAWQK
ncbi:MAG: hypothetical protein ACK4WK_05955 [Anaerolineae bacterium]